MVRQVTYDQMVVRTRETVHTRILAALESDESRRDEQDILCYHARRAKDWAKTLAYGRNVARKGVARSAFADATSHFEIAMDALDRTPPSREREVEAIDLRIEARMAFMGSGKVADWFDLGKEAERRAGAIDDIGRKVAAMTVQIGGAEFLQHAGGGDCHRRAGRWSGGAVGRRRLAQPCPIRPRPSLSHCRPLS